MRIGAYGATAALTYIYNSRINHPLYCYSLESRFVGGLGVGVGAARERRCTHGPGTCNGDFRNCVVARRPSWGGPIEIRLDFPLSFSRPWGSRGRAHPRQGLR